MVIPVRKFTQTESISVSMGKKKACRNLFQTDLRKERSPYMVHTDLSSWREDTEHAKPAQNFSMALPDHTGNLKDGEMNSILHEDSTNMKSTVEKLLPVGFSLHQFEQPRMTRVDSYRAPPLKMTLETIEEDKPECVKPESICYLRSKSLPAHRRSFTMDSTGHGLHRFPSYRPGQGDYLPGGPCEYLPGGCGVSMSGPILPSQYQDYTTTPKHRSRIGRMREALRSSRFRQAFGNVLSRMRQAGSRSH